MIRDPSKRVFDIAVAAGVSVLLVPICLLIALVMKISNKGPVIHWSDRVGINNVIFKMPKFRTMRSGAPDVATHLFENPDQWVTPIGRWLRKFSLDELPQLYSVLKGDMSLVGPRPALHNQDDLVALRTEKGIHRLVPGVTGWAQVNGRDELPIPVKVAYDAHYLLHQSFGMDLKILRLTFLQLFSGKGVHH